MTWEQIAGDMPLAVGLQLRNIALTNGDVKIIPPGRGAEAKAREILGDNAEEFLAGCE